MHEYELVFTAGDEIEVRGSRVRVEAADALLAREVIRGADTFLFRDASGKPVW
jgi:hypothetical protein